MRLIGRFLREVILLKPRSVLIATTYFHPIVAVGLVSFTTMVSSFMRHLPLGMAIQSVAQTLLWLFTLTCFLWLMCHLFASKIGFMRMYGAVSAISAYYGILMLPFTSVLNSPPSPNAFSQFVVAIGIVISFWALGMYVGTIAALSNSSAKKAALIGVLVVLMNWSFAIFAQAYLGFPKPYKPQQHQSSQYRHRPSKSQSVPLQ